MIKCFNVKFNDNYIGSGNNIELIDEVYIFEIKQANDKVIAIYDDEQAIWFVYDIMSIDNDIVVVYGINGTISYYNTFKDIITSYNEVTKSIQELL